MLSQYGYHISALNQISDVLTCRDPPGAARSISHHLLLPSCVPMTDAEFSIVTSAFTIGGLIGSLVGGRLTERKGRRGALIVDAILTTAGALALTLAPGMFTLGFGRVLIGLGAGIGVSVGPVFLGELAPPAKKGATGVLFQLAVVFGILTTQGTGLVLASPWKWRFVPLVSAVLALVQLASAAAVPESHAWLSGNGHTQEAERVRKRLWIGGSEPAYKSLSRDPEGECSIIVCLLAEFIFDLKQKLKATTRTIWKTPRMVNQRGRRCSPHIPHLPTNLFRSWLSSELRSSAHQSW